MMSISACIITFNEERNIARCIKALNGVVDEVIVVDSFSSDNTVKIAKNLGARVLQRVFDGYGTQKFFAQQQALYPWILSVDADEVVSPLLAESINAIKVKPDCDGYELAILPNYCGHWIRHCGWYPQPKLRLWNREKASMSDSKVHEGIVFHEGVSIKIKRLKGDLLHYSYHSISDHIRKIESYSEIAAKADAARGKKISLLKLTLAPHWQFFNDFILKRGFLDGYWGYIVCKNSAFASFVKYAKTRQYSKR
ncbi:MAG: glycosyltransferase family 2 protein [Bacteroidetes bacterium]|nr:glycosyltransferase family 2 protein [Bacteroidota bacterium]